MAGRDLDQRDLQEDEEKAHLNNQNTRSAFPSSAVVKPPPHTTCRQGAVNPV